ncbi:MAG: MATE family efflux transporter, partial [Turicibacter sp.]
FKLQKDIVQCGFAFFIAQLAMGFISLVYNGQLGKYGGDLAISIYAIVSSIMTFVIMPACGISQGIQPIIGYNYSSQNMGRVKETLKKASMLSVGVTAVIWLIVMLVPQVIITGFGGGDELMAIGVPALRYNFIITPILGYVMLCTTFFQSIGKPNPSIVISLLRQVVILVPLIYCLPIVFGINGIFFAQPVSDLIALVLCIILVNKEFSNQTSLDYQLNCI